MVQVGDKVRAYTGSRRERKFMYQGVDTFVISKLDMICEGCAWVKLSYNDNGEWRVLDDFIFPDICLEKINEALFDSDELMKFCEEGSD